MAVVDSIRKGLGTINDFFSQRKDKKKDANDYGRFSIETFKSEVNKTRGLATPNLFGVELLWPRTKIQQGELETVSVGLNVVNMLAYAANLPGVSAQVTEVRRQGFGPLERRVTGMSFNDVNITFLLDNDGKVLSFFQDWLRAIYSFSNIQGEGAVDEKTGGILGQVGFYDDYVGDIKLTLYDSFTQKITTYTLIDAFPGQINQIELSWRQTDEIAELQVTFYYRHFNMEVFNAAPADKAKGKRMNLLQFASKLKSAIDIVKNIRTPRSVGEALDVLNNGKTIWKGFGG